MPKPNCIQCGEEITSKYGKKFCSVRCSALNANKFAAEASRKDKSYLCEECESVFERKSNRGRFCSLSCAAKHNNKIKSDRVRHSCLGCSSSILLRVSYCSPECRTAHKIRLWLSGDFEATKAYTISKFIREHVIGKAGHKCEKCGYDKRREDGSVVLQVHHKDGNWKNSRPENLECLCPNCHALTENYGARNMGKGRTWKQDYDQFAGLADR